MKASRRRSKLRLFEKAMSPSGEIETFSYATADDPRLKRLVIRAVERMTGQPYLKRLYDEHRTSRASGENFWAAAIRSLERASPNSSLLPDNSPAS